VEPKSIKVSNKLKGYGIAITGTIEGMSREQIADKIRSLGGKFDSAVNNDTKYLIIGSSPGKSKIDRANALGIEKIDESGLRQLFDNKD
jgi:DNA ligase (NAD+)